jgi:hypothetical protein
MNRRLPFHSNAVWPTSLMVTMFVMAYGAVSVGLWLIALAVSARNHVQVSFESPEIAGIRTVILAGAGCAYALFRLYRFHPVCNPAYANWLKLTPWTVAKPLPLGPVLPVWQDAAVIGILAVVAQWHAHVPAAVPVAAFVFAYLVGFTLLMSLTRSWWHFVVLSFLWPTLMLPGAHGRLGFMVVAAIAVVIWHGHRQSLKTFPWKLIKGLEPGRNLMNVDVSFGSSPSWFGAQQNLGWPYLALSPKIRPPSVSMAANLATSGLLAWWSYCVFIASEAEPLPELIMCYGFMGALSRVGIYCTGRLPPFSVLGRIGSGRIILPGFDKIFLTPLVTAVMAVLGAVFIRQSGPWYPPVESCVLGMLTFVLLGGGPTMKEWMLTGQHWQKLAVRARTTRSTLRPV